jgi:osomolarity two-component system response regulator SKN7
MEDQGFPSQQMDLVNSQLMATQQQLEQLSERYQDLAQGHATLLQQVVHLQKFIKNHEGAMHLVLGFLRGADATKRRNSRIGAGPFDRLPNDGVTEDHPASPLQQASELLEKFSAESLPEKHPEQMSHEFHLIHNYSTPPNDHSGVSMAPPAENTSANMGYPVANDLDNMVYPVGHTNGIDPINSEHINNIPYSLPANGMMTTNPMPEMLPEGMPSILSERGGVSGRRKTNPLDCVWGAQKPRILLVEDDRVCADIGSRFLEAFGCGVETAVGCKAIHHI